MIFKSGLFWIVITVICALTILFSNSTAVLFIPGMLLICFLPGFSLSRLLFNTDKIDVIERLVVSVGFSLAISSIEFLLAFYVTPKVTTTIILSLLLITTLSLLLSNFLINKSKTTTNIPPRSFALPLLLFLFSCVLRFTYLGYSDYQGDEADDTLAVSHEILTGQKEELMTQRKGPTQILIPSVTHLFFHNYNAFLMRFPFALAGATFVLVVYLIGRQMFNETIGIIAGLLTAINGYFVAFSRVVQYQPVVLLCISLSVFFLYKFLTANSENQIRKYMLCGIFFFSFAIFSHYDGVLLFPLVIYALYEKYRSGNFKNVIRTLLYASTLCALIIGLFYLPFLLHPHFISNLQKYQQGRLGSGLHFNYDVLWLGGSLYNSRTYIIFLIVSSVLVFLKKINLSLRILLVWFSCYFIFFMIIFKEPRTHIQTFFLPWSLLAALGFFNFHNLLSKLKNPSLKRICRLVFVSIFSLVIFISTGYIYKVFIKHEPEYIWDHCPESKLRYGLFGFPYHRGWKTVGYLFRTQKLNGTYASNEKGRITHFYLRQAIVKKSQNPKYVIFSKNPQSWKKKFGIPNSFKLSAQIFVSGKPMIDIYENPKSAGKLQTYRSEEYDKFYDELDKTIP